MNNSIRSSQELEQKTKGKELSRKLSSCITEEDKNPRFSGMTSNSQGLKKQEAVCD